MASFLVRLDDDLHDRLRAAAEAGGVSMADVVRDAVAAALDAPGPDVGCEHRFVVTLSGGPRCSTCGAAR